MWVVMWCDVMWHDVMWCDVTWCDVMWCDVMWCDVMWCDVTWRDVMWCDVMWCDVMWCDVMWCDVMWCDVMWRDVMWCDVMWCDVMSQLLSVFITESTWTGQQTKKLPYIMPAWCPAQSWMTRTLHYVTDGLLTVVMLKRHYAVYADVRNRNAGGAYCILLWGSPRWQQFAAPKHRFPYVNTRYCTSEEQNVSILWLWARQGSPPAQTAQPSMPQCPNTKFKASVYSSHSS